LPAYLKGAVSLFSPPADADHAVNVEKVYGSGESLSSRRGDRPVRGLLLNRTWLATVCETLDQVKDPYNTPMPGGRFQKGGVRTFITGVPKRPKTTLCQWEVLAPHQNGNQWVFVHWIGDMKGQGDKVEEGKGVTARDNFCVLSVGGCLRPSACMISGMRPGL